MFINRFLLVVVVLVSVVLAACGDDSAKKYGDILHDKAAMAAFEAALKEYGKGKEVMVFQYVSMTTGSATINMQVPDNPANVVQQSWNSSRGWKTVPVTLTGDGNLEDNLIPLSAFNLPAIIDFVAACEKLVRDKGYSKFVVQSVTASWSWINGSLSFVAQAPVDLDAGTSAHFKGLVNGTVTEAVMQEWDVKTKNVVKVNLLE